MFMGQQRNNSNNYEDQEMSLELYHAEPAANSLKSLIPLKEKGLEFESIYVDMHKFDQHQPWFVPMPTWSFPWDGWCALPATCCWISAVQMKW